MSLVVAVASTVWVARRQGAHLDAACRAQHLGAVVQTSAGHGGNTHEPHATDTTLPSGFTVTLTVEAVLLAPRLSRTTSEKVSVVVAATEGAAKVGCATVELESVTAGLPAVWVQA